MKMVKKILLGLVATAAVIGFAGCKQVDDVNEAITGKNNDYAVDYENTSDENYRAYKSTSLKHAGALVKVTFESPDENNFSKMGLIFDLHDSKTVADAKDFYIIGLAGTSKDKNFYVSKMESIVDIQADNFGAKTTAAAGEPKETEFVALSSANKITLPPKDANGNISVYVYYKAFANGKDGTANKGYYEWGIFNFTEEQATAAKAFMKDETETGASLKTLKALGSAPLTEGTMKDAFDLGTGGALPQNQIAVYAMITKKSSLKGTWKFLDMYKEAEEITE